MMNTSTDQTLSDAMLTDPAEGGGASITGSKAPLRAREDGSPAKPEAQRTKVRAQRCSFLTTPWECFRRHRDDRSVAVIDFMLSCILTCLSLWLCPRSQKAVVDETPPDLPLLEDGRPGTTRGSPILPCRACPSLSPYVEVILNPPPQYLDLAKSRELRGVGGT